MIQILDLRFLGEKIYTWSLIAVQTIIGVDVDKIGQMTISKCSVFLFACLRGGTQYSKCVMDLQIVSSLNYTNDLNLGETDANQGSPSVTNTISTSYIELHGPCNSTSSDYFLAPLHVLACTQMCLSCLRAIV